MKSNWKLLLAQGLALFLKTRRARRNPFSRLSVRGRVLERVLGGLEKRLRKSGGRTRY